MKRSCKKIRTQIYMVIKQFKFKSKIQNCMQKKVENNSQNNDQQRKNKTLQGEQQRPTPMPITPSRRQSEQLQDELLSLMSPFQLPPKFNNPFNHLTAASNGNYNYNQDMRVIQTPYQHRPNPFRPIEFEDINQDLREITQKIVWDNTPAKGDQASSDEEEQSEINESSSEMPEENDRKSQSESNSPQSHQNPQNVPPVPTQRQFNSRTERQRHFTKRISHQKKLLEQLIAPEPNSSSKKVFCNCKKTKCLKLYCDCFRINQTCDGCNCQGCHNLQEFAEERSSAIMVLMDRNPDPFSIKIHEDKHLKGCNCKKSFCLKKYCECYQAGLKCGENCKCDECKNGGGSQQRERDRLEREGMNVEEKKEKTNEKME